VRIGRRIPQLPTAPNSNSLKLPARSKASARGVCYLLAALIFFRAFFSAASVFAQTPLDQVRSGVHDLAIDPEQTYRVREMQFARGGVKIYLSEGVLAFAKPVHGRVIAAVFTTQPVDAGDAEILTFPPNRAERSSLSSFIGSPNLDEHFTSALMFFGDNTAPELLAQIHEHAVVHPGPDVLTSLAKAGDAALQANAAQIDVRLIATLLDQHATERGFFFAMIGGRDKGAFNFAYQPDQPDSVTFGRITAKDQNTNAYFQIWSAFQPHGALPAPVPPSTISDYRIEATIAPDLSLAATAQFDYAAQPGDGTVIQLLLSSRLQVQNASVDGEPVEIYQHPTPLAAMGGGAAGFLLVTKAPLIPATHHQLRLTYQGTLVHKTSQGTYFVEDRASWYPYLIPVRSTFDLTFHCPEILRLVSTGEPVSEDVANGIRTVHRRTTVPTVLAGFNLGEYVVNSTSQGGYRIEVYANRSTIAPADILSQTSGILDKYTALWGRLPLPSVAVSPIEGYFGQAFSGLIYLSDVAYILEQDRPASLRNPRFDSFFSQMLLPHEVAHQWWGNLVSPSDYRSNWVLEGLSNYVALQYLESSKGAAVALELLAGYGAELVAKRQGKPVDSYGPVVFGERLLDNYGGGVWHDIVYEKGAWIFHMLRQILGDQGFNEMQRRLLRDYSSRPISNEDLRREAAALLPADVPDHSLNEFFDAWVYGTGIPALSLSGQELVLSDVDEDFAVNVPLDCQLADGKRVIRWIHAVNGSNVVSFSRACHLPSHSTFLYH
jgi:hypothetical protein